MALLSQDIRAKPFLKWAGRKTFLLSELYKHLPKELREPESDVADITYVEPFVGAGALFFSISTAARYFIADSNPELINCYKVVKNPNKVEELIRDLSKHKAYRKYYNNVRGQDPSELPDIERASRLIYLNHTCYNGLYRVNKEGKFNVPFNKYPNPKIFEPEVLRNASIKLRKAHIECWDFRHSLDQIPKKGDFVYLDPPYHPLGGYSDFKRYTKEFFSYQDQKDLKAKIDDLTKSEVNVLLSNSNHEQIKSLYREYSQMEVKSPRLINSDGKNRGPVKEILVWNY